MCTITIQKDLEELKKKEFVIAYKLVRKYHVLTCVGVKKYISPVFNITVYKLNKKKLIWNGAIKSPHDIPGSIGFSVLLNEQDAILVLRVLKDIWKDIQLYKVIVSTLVNAGLWYYSGDNMDFDRMKVAEFKELEFIERIA